MKKILSVLLAITVLISVFSMCFSTTAFATVSDKYTYNVESGKAIITDVHASISGDVVIPSILSGYIVSEIGDRAFYNCDNLTSVVVPDSVTSIGEVSFGFCDKLESVTLGIGVTSIPKGAFSDCALLKTVNFGDNVTAIGDYAFSNCSAIEKIAIPTKVKSLGEAAFSNCKALKNISLSDTVASIGKYVFAWCDNLKKITLGNGITEISEGAFGYCENLQTVNLGNNVQNIGDFAFCNSKIIDITIPDRAIYIGNSAFENCTELKRVTIPKTIKDIYGYAFYNCNNIAEVYYGGGEMSEINIGVYNDSLKSAIWHYAICASGKHLYSEYNDTNCANCGYKRFVRVITPSESGVYNITPNETVVFDSHNQKIEYNEKYGGWPLVNGQNYAVTLESGYDSSTQASFYLIKKLDKVFPDADSSAWYSDAVTYAVGRGIISGYGNGNFGPADSIQRQDFLVILARFDGVDLSQYTGSSRFADVQTGSYYAAAVNWGAEKGIVNGYQNGCFGVSDVITREQLVTFLYRYASYKGIDVSYGNTTAVEASRKYKDYSQVSDWSLDCVLWALENNVINGKNANTSSPTIAPQGNAQRCEVAQIMYNIFNNDVF